MARKHGSTADVSPEPVAYLTVNEAARALALRIESVYRLIYGGLLYGIQENGKWKITAASVEAYRREHSRTKAKIDG